MDKDMVKKAIFRGTTVYDLMGDIGDMHYINSFRFYHDLSEAIENSFYFAGKKGKDSVPCIVAIPERYKTEFKTERKVPLEEIKGYLLHKEEDVEKVLLNSIESPNSVLERKLGDKTDIRKISRYISKVYSTLNRQQR
ncbi:hypothetical protein GF336_02355 [Candidatus Woesearchaeota archaeon]|nr:hypothetical protein [Candidatus Woesearchaeota archaeon]